MQHHRDFSVARAHDDFDVQANERAQPLFRVSHGAHRIDHPLFGDIHRLAHDVKQDLVLALEMVVKPALAQLERSGDVVHRSRIVATLLEQARGGVQNFLPGIH